VNKVQLDIRTGHAQTVDKVLGWLRSDGGLEKVTVCDVRARRPVCCRVLTPLTRSLLRRRAAALVAWQSRWR